MRARFPLAGACAVLGCLTGSGTALGSGVPMVTDNPITSVEGQSFSGVVGTVSPCPGAGPNGDVMIDWGDGTPATEATLGTPANGACSIAPLTAHTYAVAGNYNTTVTYLYAAGVPPATDTSTAVVAEAPIMLRGGTLGGTAGTPVSGPLADLADSGGLLPAADYTATIDWGDGASSPGSVNGKGEVIGSHTYAAAGTYSPNVIVVDVGGERAQATATVNVMAAPASTPAPSSTPPACNATPPAPRPAFVPSATQPNARWVQAIYSDLLGRQPGPGELAAFASALGAGASREQVALEVEGSLEGSADLVTSLYGEYLHRAPNAGEVAIFAQPLMNGGTEENVGALLLSSPEYLASRGGETVPGFLGALFCDTLDRSLSNAELGAYTQQLGAGATRAELAQLVLTSSEYRHDLAARLVLGFLRRPPTAGDVQFFAGELQSGTSDQQLIAYLLGSQEYFNDFSGGGATLANPAVSSGGVIQVTLAQPATIQMVVLQLLPAVQKHATAGRVQPTAPRTRTVGVVKLGHHRAGHVTIHWNHKVRGHRLRHGHYLLVLQARNGQRLTDVSDAIPVTIG
jgi:PKD repeat protein